MTAEIIPIRPQSVTISRRDFKQICKAYMNAKNCMEQVLVIHRGDNAFSDAAAGRIEGILRVITQQLKEVIDGETDVLSAK